MIPDERLAAFLDGELAPAETEALSAQIAADPALAARLGALRSADDRLRAAFAGVADGPVPARLSALLAEPPGNVVSLADARARRGAVRRLPAWANWRTGGAIAATLLLGLVALSQWRGAGPQPAAGIDTELASALDSTPSGGRAQLADGGAMTPRLTFAIRDGRYCREFDRADRTAVACRTGRGWALEGEAPRSAGSDGDSDGYATAGGDGSLDRVYARLGAGEPLDAASERRLIARGWKK